MAPTARTAVSWKKTKDGSIVDRNGKVIYFSTERFVRDIGLGNSCFICGAAPNSKPFNHEHVLPEWLLRRFDLFKKAVTLPNGRTIRYDRYTVPCCKDCNDFMGSEIEQLVSTAVRKGPRALTAFVRKDRGLRLFVWLGLIFLKTHLRDKLHRVHLDTRKGSE